MIQPDSLIFDMDGTLWDNVDTYAVAWTKGMERIGHDREISREDILGLMGKEANVMLNALIPDASDEEHDRLFTEVINAYQELVPTMTPKIFDGVLEGLKLLSEKYPLFLLSNCEEGGLVNFMNHTRTRHLIKDYMEHGMNLQPKYFNLQLLVDRHRLNAPVYVGDTNSDSKEAALAGVPFVYVTYGFGNTGDYALKFNSFTELTDYFLHL